jgi:hypothetical protein
MLRALVVGAQLAILGFRQHYQKFKGRWIEMQRAL